MPEYTEDIDAIIDLMTTRDMAGPDDTLSAVMAILDQAGFTARDLKRIRLCISDNAPDWWPNEDLEEKN